MNNAKKRRKEARASQFGGHTPDVQYRPEEKPATETLSGRAWDSEKGEKAEPTTPETGHAGDVTRSKSDPARH